MAIDAEKDDIIAQLTSKLAKAPAQAHRAQQEAQAASEAAHQLELDTLVVQHKEEMTNVAAKAALEVSSLTNLVQQQQQELHQLKVREGGRGGLFCGPSLVLVLHCHCYCLASLVPMCTLPATGHVHAHGQAGTLTAPAPALTVSHLTH
jgi:hypothetical protein